MLVKAGRVERHLLVRTFWQCLDTVYCHLEDVK